MDICDNIISSPPPTTKYKVADIYAVKSNLFICMVCIYIKINPHETDKIFIFWRLRLNNIICTDKMYGYFFFFVLFALYWKWV